MPKTWFNFKETSTKAASASAKKASAKASAKASTKASAKGSSVSAPATKKISLRKTLSNLFTRKRKSSKKLSTIKEEKHSEDFFDAFERIPSEKDEFQQKLSDFKKKRSSRIITKFMRNTTVKRKANFLGKKCPDSGVCMALGIYTNDIKKFFGGFTDFSNCEDSIKRIGAVSANGFINEIKYVNKNAVITMRKSTVPGSIADAGEQIQYTAYAILKSSGNINADNLMYEYSVGKFINKQNKIFPSFLETYGLYKYTSFDAWKIMRSASVKTRENLIQGLIPQSIDYKEACTQSIYIAILIQHFKDVKSLKTALHDKKFLESYDLTYILFQIYYTLSALADTFTHYDLHWNNVLLYEPEKDKYIEYHYHSAGDSVISFKSNYMIKIIDYGRSFFYYNPIDNSEKIHQLVCKTKECTNQGIKNPDITYTCGEARGFYWLDIQNKINNVSADLRLLAIIYDTFKKFNPINSSQFYLKEKLKLVIYNQDPKTKSAYQVKKTGFPFAINNVTDAFLEIKDLISKNYNNIVEKNNEQFENKQKIGDLHIYDDRRPMEFIPYNPTIKEIEAFLFALELQILDLKTDIFKLSKRKDLDRYEDINKAYEKIVLLENKKTNLYFNKIDIMNDLAALETISKDLESSIRPASTMRPTLSRRTSSRDESFNYELDFLLLNNNNLKKKMEYVNKRIEYLIRKKPYTKRNETDV
jgi:hypothetical protein